MHEVKREDFTPPPLDKPKMVVWCGRKNDNAIDDTAGEGRKRLERDGGGLLQRCRGTPALREGQEELGLPDLRSASAGRFVEK